MLRLLFLISIGFLAGCQLPAEKKAREAQLSDTVMPPNWESHDTSHDAKSAEDTPLIVPKAAAQKDPKGYYQTTLPGGIEHIVAFYSDHSYQLQERYKKDSLVVIRGNWSPSNGFIWLYKDQIVRARYRWKGDALEYYSPALKKGFGMSTMVDIAGNKVWREKKAEGISFFGIGNEPFWSVEIKADSVAFRLADWKESLRTSLALTRETSDSLVYDSGDSLRITILPFFCSDGMSDHIYGHAVKVTYKNQLYQGCGQRY